MRSIHTTLGQIIHAIGEDDFASRTVQALCEFTGFDLAAVMLHRNKASARILFDDFDRIGCRGGIETYASKTFSVNPMLACAVPLRAVRARDFRRPLTREAVSLPPDVIEAPDEELGYRTVGWPERHEEIGLYFKGWDGLIEFGLYRARGRKPASGDILSGLNHLSEPLAAAFDRHRALEHRSGGALRQLYPGLTAREREVCDLMLLGCSSDGIALRLGITRHTVKDHRKRIFRKLELGSLAELFSLHRQSPLRGDGVPGATCENHRSTDEVFRSCAM
jgi:DNA-binding CsgD family transcriptional regulator